MTHAKPATIPEYPHTVDVVPMGAQCTTPALHLASVSRHRHPYAGGGRSDVSA